MSAARPLAARVRVLIAEWRAQGISEEAIRRALDEAAPIAAREILYGSEPQADALEGE